MGDANKELVSNLRNLVELVKPGKSLDDRRGESKGLHVRHAKLVAT